MNHNHSSIKRNIRIGVVGPCSAGKTTLIKGLVLHGYSARHIAQEHSYVADMWKRLVNPDILIYLDVSYKASMQRRPLNLTLKEFEEQNRRLVHARKGAHLYLHTDRLSIKDVMESVLVYLDQS